MHTAKMLIALWLLILASGFEPLIGGTVVFEWHPFDSLRSVLVLLLPFVFLGFVITFSWSETVRGVGWICLISWALWSIAFIFFGGMDNLIASRDTRYTLLRESKQDNQSWLRTYNVATDSLSADITLVRMDHAATGRQVG